MDIRLAKNNIIMLELIGVLILHLFELVIRYPCNHTNALMFCYKDCVYALALFEIIYSFARKEICILFWVVFSLSFTIPVVEDKCNILIPYDTWTSRGMPDWGHPTAGMEASEP